MSQFLRDQASDSDEVVTPLMLDGTYLSRNFATLGPTFWQPPCVSSSFCSAASSCSCWIYIPSIWHESKKTWDDSRLNGEPLIRRESRVINSINKRREHESAGTKMKKDTCRLMFHHNKRKKRQKLVCCGSYSWNIGMRFQNRECSMRAVFRLADDLFFGRQADVCFLGFVFFYFM